MTCTNGDTPYIRTAGTEAGLLPAALAADDVAAGSVAFVAFCTASVTALRVAASRPAAAEESPAKPMPCRNNRKTMHEDAGICLETITLYYSVHLHMQAMCLSCLVEQMLSRFHRLAEIGRRMENVCSYLSKSNRQFGAGVAHLDGLVLQFADHTKHMHALQTVDR